MAEFSKVSFMALSDEAKWELFQKSETKCSSLEEVNGKLDLLIGKIAKLESDVLVTKSVNVGLKSEILNLRRKINRDSMYNRQENLEISGIPESVSDRDLERTTRSLLRKVGVDCNDDEIVDCHRLRNKKNVIIRFTNRRYALKALANSKNLRNNTNDILPNSMIYVNRNLTPEYKTLRWQAKKVKGKGYIVDFGVNRRGIWVKAAANGAKKQIDIAEDLHEFIPDGFSLSEICN